MVGELTPAEARADLLLLMADEAFPVKGQSRLLLPTVYHIPLGCVKGAESENPLSLGNHLLKAYTD